MDRFWWKFVWILISKRHNLSLNYIWHEMSLLCYRKILRIFFTWPSELITTLTYILMDNCFPFFCIIEYIFFLANELAKMIKTKDVYKTKIKKVVFFMFVCSLVEKRYTEDIGIQGRVIDLKFANFTLGINSPS